MSDAVTINKYKFSQYRDIQDSGMFNMYDPRAREMTSLSRSEWIYILKNYSELKEKYEGGE
tara:strand:+ start:567 stop:749 length:183 start_codon:yes stop_codon:yes gene_type:complete